MMHLTKQIYILREEYRYDQITHKSIYDIRQC